MTIRGVLFDFSGTLFRLKDHEHWLTGLDDELRLTVAEQAELMHRMTATAHPSTLLPPEWHDAWDRRDLDPELHRQVYSEILRRSGLPGEVADAIYGGLVTPKFWEPYPDTERALRTLRAAGIPVAVVSNIAWDITESFAAEGIADLVDTFVLSYVEGIIKPDREIFRIACERIAIDPADALMIGDSAEADGGAAALGARVALVDPLPVRDRPHALLDALTTHNLP